MSEKSMEDIWKALVKQHGDEGLFHGTDSMVTSTEVIPTGSYALDDAIGLWGLPKGRVIQYAGQESSGKTYMSLMAIAEYQKLNPRNWGLFIDAEFTFDKEWAQLLGVDLERLLVYRENNGIKVFERLIGQPSKTSSKKSKLGLLDLELENPTGLGIIVLDSVAYLKPPQEETSEVGKQNMALLARFLPPVLRQLTPMLTYTGISFIAINQIRMDPSVMWGSPESSPGGTALKHAASLMVNFSKVAAKDSKIMVGDNQIGHHVRVRIDKNKLAPPFRKADLALTYTNGITDKNLEIRDIGAKYGVIERPNSKTWILDGQKYNGKEAMAEALLDEKLQLSVLERAKEAKKNAFVAELPIDMEEEEC